MLINVATSLRTYRANLGRAVVVPVGGLLATGFIGVAIGVPDRWC